MYYQFGGSKGIGGNIFIQFNCNGAYPSIEIGNISNGSTSEYIMTDYKYTTSVHAGGVASVNGGKYYVFEDNTYNTNYDSTFDTNKFPTIVNSVAPNEKIFTKVDGNNNFRFIVVKLE